MLHSQAHIRPQNLQICAVLRKSGDKWQGSFQTKRGGLSVHNDREGATRILEIICKSYRNIDGIATSKPATVVINAAETPGAMAAIVAVPCWATCPNVLITPQTVPSSPKNGAPLTAIASRIRPDSSLSDSCATVFSRARNLT